MELWHARRSERHELIVLSLSPYLHFLALIHPDIAIWHACHRQRCQDKTGPRTLSVAGMPDCDIRIKQGQEVQTVIESER